MNSLSTRDELSISKIPSIRLDETDRESTVQKIRHACMNVGFFYLEGHGIEQSMFDTVLAQSKSFFGLPLASKRALSDKVMSRGYTGMEEETLDPSSQSKGDTKEGFYIGREISPTDPQYNPAKFCGPNQWPDELLCSTHIECFSFRTTMELYFTTISAVALRVIQLLALAIGVDEHYFDSSFSDPLAVLRLLHYSGEPSRPEDGIFACGAHSDYGMITLLLTDSTPGLQIFTKDNIWLDAPPVAGALVVNLGDMLERWTNGIFRSTKHRVLTAGGTERYSIPFFYEPNFDTVVECLSECCDTEINPGKYPRTTSGQHLLEKYKQTHADFKPETKKN
jgi:isopenicillin N synthase-like dioxygenase|uniref:Fe2OG dioxygenase domain-containing protein n=1 Tax=Phaeodactylum tricornutum TaxID=2850 RepID=A0A8J9RZE9_PHATR